MDVCAGARWVLRNAKVGKESQEGEQEDQQALGNHQPLSLCTATVCMVLHCLGPSAICQGVS